MMAALRRNIVILVCLILVILLGLTFVFKSCRRAATFSGSKTKSYVQSIGGLFQLAKSLQEKGRLLDAKKAYQRILSGSEDNRIISQAQDELYKLNMRIIFSTLETEQTIIYEVKSGDTLHKIAKKYNTTTGLIKRSNGLKGNTIRPYQRLRIWTGKFSVIVDKSQNTLTLKSAEEIIKVYTVSTGKDNSTPVGSFKINSKLIDPVWYKQGAIVLPDSPENILGSRWLGISLPGYGIHGTTESESIGKQITAGCVRMANSDVEDLFDILPEGTEVTIID